MLQRPLGLHKQIFLIASCTWKFDQTYKKVAKFSKKKFFTKFFLDYDLWRNRKRLITKISIGYEGRHIAQKKEHKKSFQKMKKNRGGWGSEQGQISLWSFGTWNFGFFHDFWGFGAQKFIFLRIFPAKFLNLYVRDPLHLQTLKITTKYYDNSWKMSKISKSAILDLKSAIAPTMIIRCTAVRCHKGQGYRGQKGRFAKSFALGHRGH